MTKVNCPIPDYVINNVYDYVLSNFEKFIHTYSANVPPSKSQIHLVEWCRKFLKHEFTKKLRIDITMMCGQQLLKPLKK